MHRSGSGVTVRRMMAVVAIIALGLAGFDAAFFRPIRVHSRWFKRVRADLESLQHKRPPDVERREWAYVVGWTLNAHGNCCSARDFVDPALTEGFADELERRLRGRVGIGTIDWIWDEFMRISRVKSYDRFRPTTPEHLKEAAHFTWVGIEVE